MSMLDRLRRHSLAVAAGAGALLGVLIGLFLPIRAAAPIQAADADWALPAAKDIARFKDTDYQQVRSARIWGDNASQGRRGSVQWDLVAIVTQPTVRVAVMVGGGKSAWVRPGDTLPDGAVLVGANRDAAWYEKDGCRASRKLYPSAKEEPADSCAGTEPATAASRPAPPAAGRRPAPASPTSGSKPSR